MRFNSEDNFSKITLGESYNKNYKFLFKDNDKNDNHGVYLFNNIPVFKYKKLILRYNKMPSEDQIKIEIQNFMDKVNVNNKFKVFNIKGNVFKNCDGLTEYVVNVAFINFNLK